MDSTTRQPVNIDFTQWRRHKGEEFYVRDSATLALLNDKRIMHIITSSDVNRQLEITSFKYSADKLTTLSILEDVSVSANGTALTPLQKNRTSGFALGAQFFHTPTITGSTTIFTRQFAGTTTLQTISELTGLILKPNTKYALQLNADAASDAVSFEIVFREVDKSDY